MPGSGVGATQPLTHCPSWSKASLTPEQLWSERRYPSAHASSPQALRTDLLAGTCWMLGWTEVPSKAQFWSLGEVVELCERAWHLGRSLPEAVCWLSHPSKARAGACLQWVPQGTGREQRAAHSHCFLHPVARRSPPGQCPSEGRAREPMRKKENGLQVSERNSTQRELSRVFSPTPFSPSLLQGPGQTRLTDFREGGGWRAGRERQALSMPGPTPNPVMVLCPRRDPRGPPGGGEAGRPPSPRARWAQTGAERPPPMCPLLALFSTQTAVPLWPAGQLAPEAPLPRSQCVCEKGAQPSRLEQPSRTGPPACVSRSQKQTELGGQSWEDRARTVPDARQRPQGGEEAPKRSGPHGTS